MYEILKQKFPGREKQIEQLDCATASSVRKLLILYKFFILTLPNFLSLNKQITHLKVYLYTALLPLARQLLLQNFLSLMEHMLIV